MAARCKEQERELVSINQRWSNNLDFRTLCAKQKRSGFYEQNITDIYRRNFADMIHRRHCIDWFTPPCRCIVRALNSTCTSDSAFSACEKLSFWWRVECPVVFMRTQRAPVSGFTNESWSPKQLFPTKIDANTYCQSIFGGSCGIAHRQYNPLVGVCRFSGV